MQTEMWWGRRHLLTSARLILYSHKAAGGLPLHWPKQACKGFIWPWRQSLMSFMWPTVEWINSLILTLKRAHKIDYRDGVSDYIRLFVYGVEEGLVYSVHSVCVWRGRVGGEPAGTYIPWKKAAVHFYGQNKNADLTDLIRQLTQEWNGSKNLHLSAICGTHSSCLS